MTTQSGRFVGQFVLFALLFNILTTSILSAKGADILQSDEVQAGFQSYVICTPQGLKRITVDANGDPVGDSDESREHCVYCLSFCQAGSKILSEEIVISDGDNGSVRLIYLRDADVKPRLVLDDTRPPRGPPAISDHKS